MILSTILFTAALHNVLEDLWALCRQPSLLNPHTVANLATRQGNVDKDGADDDDGDDVDDGPHDDYDHFHWEGVEEDNGKDKDDKDENGATKR